MLAQRRLGLAVLAARDHITGATASLNTLDAIMDTLEKKNTVPKPAADKKVLRARPLKGAIDYAELSREHIARYPKIRARLAE
jgi:hypothetical protein